MICPKVGGATLSDGSVLKADGQLAGDCGLMRQKVDGVTETEVGYHLARRFQGQGLATEAARACIDHAFSELGLLRVISLIRPENGPSRRVAERNGMSIEKEAIFAALPHLVYRLRSKPARAEAHRVVGWAMLRLWPSIGSRTTSKRKFFGSVLT